MPASPLSRSKTWPIFRNATNLWTNDWNDKAIKLLLLRSGELSEIQFILSLFALSFLLFLSTSLNSFSCICPCWLGGASQLFCCVSNYHFIKDDSFGGRGTVSTGSSGRSACQIRCMKGNYPSTPAIHHFVLGESTTLIRISGNCAEYISWYQ